MRDQRFIEALDTYNSYLDKFDMISLGQDLSMLIKDHYESTKFLLKNDEDRAKNKKGRQQTYQMEEMVKIYQKRPQMQSSVWVQNLIRAYQKKWGYEECYKYAALSEFDYVIRKQCELTKKVPDKLIEKAFFKILIPLGQLQKQVYNKLSNNRKQFTEQQ